MNTTEKARVLCVEQVDDIPVLLATLERLGMAEHIDRHYRTHHNFKGELTVGEVLTVWITFILSTGDHRLYNVQPWAQSHLLTLQACLGKKVDPLDFHDDRLADLLDVLAEAQRWLPFQDDLNQQTVRVYKLPTELFRIDTTTVSSYASVRSEKGVLQFGHSKGNSDLPQLKVAATTLDPLGLPVTSVALPGNTADDNLYIPEIKKVQQSFGTGGHTFVGDSKMASLANRTYLAGTEEFYLCPLSEKQLSQPERRQLLQKVWQGQQQLHSVFRAQEEEDEEEPELLAEGFCYDVDIEAEHQGQSKKWTERRWLVRSLAFAEGQTKKLERRLDQATQELEQLPEPRQGKKRLDRPGLQSAAVEILQRHRVTDLLEVQVRTLRHKRKVRGYAGKPSGVKCEVRYAVEVNRQVEEIEEVQRHLGWQVYGTNQVELPIKGVVLAYRDQYKVERSWSRLKGKRLGIEPMFLKEESRMKGLVHLLMLAVRVLTLLEWQVRDQLHKKGETLKGVYPGQPGRQTSRPSAELLLKCFQGLCLTLLEIDGVQSLHSTELNDVQRKLLHLWNLPMDLFQKLQFHFAIPPPFIGER